jgi:uncharacterized NAD(P)/FAD-binding protein YdhS
VILLAQKSLFAQLDTWILSLTATSSGCYKLQPILRSAGGITFHDLFSRTPRRNLCLRFSGPRWDVGHRYSTHVFRSLQRCKHEPAICLLGAWTVAINSFCAMPPSKIDLAICGGGACGLAVLISVLEENRKAAFVRSIWIFEKRDKVGPGLAYSEGSEDAIINMRADIMGLYASDPLHFTRWRQAHHPLQAAGQYPPRAVYGKYLCALFDSAVQDAKSQDVGLTIVHREVLSIQSHPEGFVVHDDIQRSFVINKAVLALGNFPALSQPHLRHCPGYIHRPWPLSDLDVIPTHSSVCIIGSRLSALDAAFYLISRGHRTPICLASRGGRLPKVQAREAAGVYRHVHLLSIMARDLEELEDRSKAYSVLVDTFRTLAEQSGISAWPEFLLRIDPSKQLLQDVRDAESGTARWRLLSDGSAPIFERYWSVLPLDDKRGFLKQWNSLWYAYVHAMPYQNGVRLFDLLEQGKLFVTDFESVCETRVDGVQGFTVHRTENSIQCDYLIDASGLETAVSRMDSALLKSMLSTRMIEAHDLGGVCVDTLSLETTTTPGLYAVGVLTTGVHFYNNGIDRNVVHASRIAQHLAGKRAWRQGHVALVLQESSQQQQNFAEQLIPRLIERGLLPFVYIMPGDDTITGEVCTSSIDNEDSLDNLCTTYGIFVGKCFTGRSACSEAMTKHHIDVGLLLTGPESTSSLQPQFNAHDVFEGWPSALLRRSDVSGGGFASTVGEQNRNALEEESLVWYEMALVAETLAVQSHIKGLQPQVGRNVIGE